MVEHRLAKARVEGSNPFSRSSLSNFGSDRPTFYPNFRTNLISLQRELSLSPELSLGVIPDDTKDAGVGDCLRFTIGIFSVRFLTLQSSVIAVLVTVRHVQSLGFTRVDPIAPDTLFHSGVLVKSLSSEQRSSTNDQKS